jgi:Tol biopolymer transport system component/DNA-binding winged helix-turn-helix (wHTH) protein
MPPEIKGFQFGGFVLDCAEEKLLLDAEPVSLTPKAFLLLKTLVENQGKVLTKSELMEAVWPDSFVEEGNLPFTAFSLRKTLGDNSDDPRFIETVPRRGYKFIAPVTPIFADQAEPDDETSLSTADEPMRDKSRWPRLAPTLAVTAAALILTVWGILFVARAWSKPAAPILSRTFSVEQLSTSGNSANAAISPDGKYVVYSDESGGKQSLWLRNLDTSESVQIVPPSDDQYLGLTFSGGGTSVYFVRLPFGVHALPSLYRIETIGGVPVKLSDHVNKRIALSEDDTRIAFARCRYRRGDFCSLIVADANGANERKLMGTENGVHIWDVRFSPDGRVLAVATGRTYNDSNASNIFEIDPETGEQRDVFSERFAEVGSLEWVPDGSGILFSASDFQDGKASIYLADRRTGKLEQLTRDAASYETLTLDRAATSMVAIQKVPDFRLHVVAGGTTTKLAVASDLDALPGGRIVYSTFDGEIWSVNPDGSEQRQLTRSRQAESSVCVSPDGKVIYFSTDESGSRQVWRMNADGSDRRQLTQSVGGYPLTATADGKYVFYESTLDSHLRKVASDGSEEIAVHDKLLRNPAISPDGALAAYFFTDAMVRKLAVMDLNTKQNIKVLEAPAESLFDRYLAWSADAKTLYYVTKEDGKTALWRKSLDDTPPQKIADLGDGQVLGISPAENGNFAYIIGGWRFDVMLLRGLG